MKINRVRVWNSFTIRHRNLHKMLEESTFCLFNGKIMKNGHHLITFLKVKGHFHWPNVYTSLCRHEITKYCHMHTLSEPNHISTRNLINTPTQSTTMEISIKMLMLNLKRHFSIWLVECNIYCSSNVLVFVKF